jgi:hypothetical protein
LSSNTERDLDPNVVPTLKQPEGCGPSESAIYRFHTAPEGRGPGSL